MVHAEAHDPSVAKTEFGAAIAALGITQHRVARLFGVGPRSIRRWQDGDRRVPCGVSIVVRLLACGAVTVDQVEAVVAIPARTNGSAKLEPPAPLLVAPAPEQSPRRAEAAALADPGLTTVEKVVALAPGACRWPCGDPARPDFRFCGGPVARGPYCETSPRHGLHGAADWQRAWRRQRARRSWVAIGHRSPAPGPGPAASANPHNRLKILKTNALELRCYGSSRGTGLANSVIASPLSSRSNARCSGARIEAP